jgi:lipopolysaccharide/colanic/teichoic acid biosynthesis glycosyltransferase
MRHEKYAVMKRGVDLAGGVLLLLVTSPLVAASMAAVLIESGPPVIHRRHVVGRRGRPFDAYKIRSMVRRADELIDDNETLRTSTSASAKTRRDFRVTRVGRWLRRSSIDELPQLVNVVRGQMSLVGPRMITPEELPEWGGASAPVLAVRPGMTGLWQVSGRQLLSRDQRIVLDGQYVERMSIALDMRILARTVPAVLSGRGAL